MIIFDDVETNEGKGKILDKNTEEQFEKTSK